MKNMNLKKRVSYRAGGTVLLLMSAPAVYASPVIMAPPATTDTTPTWSEQESTNNEMQVFIPNGEFRRAPDSPFSYGPFVLRPHVSYGFMYATGLLAATNNAEDTIIQTVSPGVTLDMGQHWTVDYTPTLTFYSNTKFNNSLDQIATLNGATRYGDWNFGLSQSYNRTSSLLNETAQQTQQEDYSTGLNAGYAISDRWLATFALNQDFLDNTGFNSSKTWSTTDGLDYTFWERLTVGATVGAGYVDLSNSGSQQYESLEGVINWRATDKLSLSLSGGFEEQEYSASGEANALNPIFSVSIQYQPFKGTQLSFSANRAITTSDLYVLASSQISTSANVGVSQQLLKNFFLSLNAGYLQNDFTEEESFSEAQFFHSPGAGFPGTTPPGSFSEGLHRTDNSYTFNATLSHAFLKRGNIALTYQYTDYQSNTAGYSYKSNQVGIQMSFNY